MGEKLIVGPFSKGLRNDRPPFMIDNESFPTLINAYQWRGRIKRKRGTQFLCRLQRYLGTTDEDGNLTVTISPHPIDSGIISVTVGTDVFTDQGGSSPVTMITNSAGSALLYRSTGVLEITGSQADTAVLYYPSLPVMGLEEAILSFAPFPGTVAFDTVYSYNVSTAFPYSAYDISFYKNPASAGSYTEKTDWTRLNWNGQDYQQFWSTNYEGALWVTNGVPVPFVGTNIGMQFQSPDSATWDSSTEITFTITSSPLVVGDFVFANEWAATDTPANAATLNFQTGYVTLVEGDDYTVTFPNADIADDTYTDGILQYLTNNSDSTKDCIRWYDGDPTNGSSTAPVNITGKGWVNFMPPLSQGPYSIAGLPVAQWYLVGARMIIPFKDRLLFLGPVVQTSSEGTQVYLQDTIIYSQNGVPFYTASWSGNVFSTSTGFVPLCCPISYLATPYSFWEDQTGFGGNIEAGFDRAITTVSTNEDALIVGFDSNIQTRVIYSGNDIVPFNFFIINAEMGSSSTFSSINMDFGVLTRGNRGYIITSQTEVSRIDLELPDEVFQTQLTNNGTERVTAQRDFINEWIYFTYPSDIIGYVFPNTTLQYNYRDNSWAIFYESYTTYGSFRKQSGFTWSTVGDVYPSWDSWNDPWNAGQSELLQPQVIGGNQQGFVLVRGVGTSEGTSLTIQNISGQTITCPNHCLNVGDFFLVTGALGTIDPKINYYIFQVDSVTDDNNFIVGTNFGDLTYEGGGLITRIYVPQIQTKQFQMSWDMARKTRIGPQQYLFTTTSNGQITVQIYLSQNANTPYNFTPNAPVPNNDSALIYSQLLYTCPESTNLGLIPASKNMLNPFNTNLQIPTAIQQAQTWHRINTSLIGDTVQIGFTMSPEQIMEKYIVGNTIEITGATQEEPCVLTCTAPFSVETGALVLIGGVEGMTQLNGNTYSVITSDSTTITIDVNATLFSEYTSGGSLVQVAGNPFAEIKLHGFILDLNPSQLLV